MSDRTMIAVGGNAFSVPKLAKRALEVAIAVALSAFTSLVILLASYYLTARGGYVSGIEAWYSFIKKPDILGTMVLTAIVTVSFLIWQRNHPTSKR